MIEPLKMFSPKLEITPEHREYFAGRRDDFRHALDAIAVPGSAYALAGEGGVGKTSLALQLKDILQGETTLLDTLGIRSELTSSVKRYKCAWLKVTTGIDDIETLLAALMEESELPWSLYALFPKAFTASKQPEEMTRDYEGNLGVFKAKAQFKSTLNQHDVDRRDVVAKSSVRARTHREFQNLLARISKHYSDSVIIFIDDFQRVKNREGMGELIKDTDQARFFVVGIADDVRELIRDHPGRKLEGSTRILRPMAEGDVLEILNRAERQYPGVITFADDYRKAMVQYSEGYPWLVQMIGYHSVLTVAKGASKAKPISLGRDSVRDAVLRVASPAGDDERYQRLVGAVGTSPSRQRVLFALADAPYGWVEKKSLKIALDEQARGLDSHLQQLADANVIKRDKETRVRFVEPLIRAVARFARERGSVIAGEQPQQNG